MSGKLAQAVQEFEGMMQEPVVAKAAALVAAGEAAWQVDPEVPGAYGLVFSGTRHAAVVVYAPHEGYPFWDCELDALLEG